MLLLAGVTTDIGIEFTGLHALVSGYNLVITEDATGAYSDEEHERSIAFLLDWNPVGYSAEICAIWLRCS